MEVSFAHKILKVSLRPLSQEVHLVGKTYSSVLRGVAKAYKGKAFFYFFCHHAGDDFLDLMSCYLVT